MTSVFSLGRITKAAAGVLVAGVLAGCGSSAGTIVVASVGTHTITKAALDHWTAIEGVLSLEYEPTKALPKGAVPDPPSFKDCTAFQRTREPPGTPTSTLRGQCATRYRVLQRHMLNLLITSYWTSGESAARGVKVSDAEVQTALHRQFPTTSALARYMRFSGASEADERQLLRTNILTTKLQEKISGGGLSGASPHAAALARFLQQFPRKWKPKTTCRPGYVVAECKEYRGARQTE